MICSRRRGTAMVELALILPLILTLIFVIMDFGYYLFLSISVNNATREAARKGSMNTMTRSQIAAQLQQNAVAVAIPAGSVDVAVNTADTSVTHRPPTVQVTTNFTYRPFAAALYPFSNVNVRSVHKSVIQTYEGSTTIAALTP
jgi:Flp pilus assembly protein TadG